MLQGLLASTIALTLSTGILYPQGGGEMQATIRPAAALLPLRCTEPGPLKDLHVLFNGPYSAEHLNFGGLPMGGLGAGMICLESYGQLTHFSIGNKPAYGNEPPSAWRRATGP